MIPVDVDLSSTGTIIGSCGFHPITPVYESVEVASQDTAGIPPGSYGSFSARERPEGSGSITTWTTGLSCHGGREACIGRFATLAAGRPGGHRG